MFSIDTGTFRLQLEVAPVKALCHHEEIIPEEAQKLVLEFRNWANLQNPIIVDENYIVLDGNHRLFAFRKLNFRYIPISKIDYFDESAQLRYWFRLLGRVDSLVSVTKTVSDMGGSIRQVKDRHVLSKALEKDSFCCGIQQGGFYAFISFPEDIVYDAVSAYNALEELQSRLVGTGMKVEYIPCQPVCDGDFCETPERGEAVLWTPRITKEMVVAAAKEEKVFAPKATRHLIPARPLNVNVPIRWFKEDVSLEDINERFREFLGNKRLKRFGPGQVINGRYYEEELFVFFDERQ